jgi:hypothetical protein
MFSWVTICKMKSPRYGERKNDVCLCGLSILDRKDRRAKSSVQVREKFLIRRFNAVVCNCQQKILNAVALMHGGRVEWICGALSVSEGFSRKMKVDPSLSLVIYC